VPVKKISPELAAAIRRMPADKKDKLLLRLIAKDKILVEQLIFELLENKETIEERSESVKLLIKKTLEEASNYHFTPGILMMNLRALNGRITEHVKITKDKLGEVTLTLYLLAEAFRLYLPKLQKISFHSPANFSEYVIRRLQFALKKAEKLHEDYHLEFKDELQNVLDFVHHFSSTARIAKEGEVPRRWEMK